MEFKYKFLPGSELFQSQHRQSEDRDKSMPHVSSILRTIGIKAGIIKEYGGKNDTYGSGWDPDLTPECGFLWEDVFAVCLGDRVGNFRPGPLVRDGIIGSPDGIGEHPEGTGEIILVEYKFTWKSSRNSLENNWYWVNQAMAYMAMSGLKTTMFHILYVLGDYRGSGPQYQRVEMRCHQGEIDATWDMIVRHKEEGYERETK